MRDASVDNHQTKLWSAFIVRACLCLLIILSGLALRRWGPGSGLSAFVVKYGGSVLWGTMAFFLVALAASHLSRPRIAVIAVAIAIGVELFLLVHVPWLDAFRLTLPGTLLPGRVFSAWNLLAYGTGICLGVMLDHLRKRALRRLLRGLSA